MPPDIHLRDVSDADIPVFRAQQMDAEAIHMAAFTPAEPSDEVAFAARWARLRADHSIVAQTIVVNDLVAGHIARFVQDGDPKVTYWLGRAFWGQGIATHALALFLAQGQVQPLFARAAADNLASLRVLQKCGFVICGEESGFAAARGTEIAEYVLRLD